MAPRIRRERPEEAALLRAASPLRVRARGLTLHGWRFGKGPPVLVQHGWGGRTSQMAPLIAAIVDAGFSVVAVDAPGHGASGWRARTSIVHFADAIEALIASEGPVVAAVAHSLGASGLALATSRGLSIEAAVVVAPFAKPGGFFRGFLRWVGLSPAAIERVQTRAEASLGVRFDALDLGDALQAPRSLIIHDVDDRRVPYAGSVVVAEERSDVELRTTQGLGHSRILADTSVQRTVIEALRATPGLRAWDRSPRRAPSPTNELTLDEINVDLGYGRS